MPKKWEDIDANDILNADEAHTGKMAQYDRIMQYKLTESVSELSEKLKGVMETIYKAHQGFKEKADEVQNNYSKISKDQIDTQKKIANSQSRLQKWIIALTFLIAIATSAYVCITWMSVTTMKESNEIQRQFLELEKEKIKKVSNN